MPFVPGGILPECFIPAWKAARQKLDSNELLDVLAIAADYQEEHSKHAEAEELRFCVKTIARPVLSLEQTIWPIRPLCGDRAHLRICDGTYNLELRWGQEEGEPGNQAFLQIIRNSFMDERICINLHKPDNRQINSFVIVATPRSEQGRICLEYRIRQACIEFLCARFLTCLRISTIRRVIEIDRWVVCYNTQEYDYFGVNGFLKRIDFSPQRRYLPIDALRHIVITNLRHITLGYQPATVSDFDKIAVSSLRRNGLYGQIYPAENFKPVPQVVAEMSPRQLEDLYEKPIVACW